MGEVDEVCAFWFQRLKPAQWFDKDASLDAMIAERFGPLHASVALCECAPWRATPKGRLAEIIVLDQFSRNIFRDTPRAFACDTLALALAQEAVRCGADVQLSTQYRSFLYMPYMHSESKIIHEEAMRLYSQPGLERNLDYALQHKRIIDRFGRYPHRNKILGRASSEAEVAFLQEPHSSF